MIISIKVHPNSQKQDVVKINDNEYKVELKEKAKNNKANIELITLIARYFKTDFSNVKIKSGLTSRKKLVEVKI